MKELTEILKEMQIISNDNNLEIDVYEDYQYHYTVHRYKNGSNKRFIADGDSYVRAMQERYDYILNCINQSIENRLEYLKYCDTSFNIDDLKSI